MLAVKVCIGHFYTITKFAKDFDGTFTIKEPYELNLDNDKQNQVLIQIVSIEPTTQTEDKDFQKCEQNIEGQIIIKPGIIPD